MSEMWHTVTDPDEAAPRGASIRSASLEVAGGTLYRSVVSSAEGIAISQVFVPNPPAPRRLSHGD